MLTSEAEPPLSPGAWSPREGRPPPPQSRETMWRALCLSTFLTHAQGQQTLLFKIAEAWAGLL